MRRHPEPAARARPPLGDAHLRRALLAPRRATRCSGATWPRGRPACRSPSTCPPRPATTRTTSWPPARWAGSACRWRTSATCGRSSTASTSAAANTSMTINAHGDVAARALRHRRRRSRARELARCAGTTQNDIIKEYLSRGHVHLPAGAVAAADHRRHRVDGARTCPQWNPVNICSYHLQEAGATPVQEVGFALATAVAVLDAVRDSGQVPAERMGDVVAADLVLRQRRGALRRGDGEDARVRRALGRDHPRRGTA